ncbi:hypothetical protein Mapa_016731 [Marchantia paleacea]|nr:hypothetical protein Mapa_016731 [Marchantia paleacea]
MRSHGPRQLTVEVVPPARLQIPVLFHSDYVRQIVLRHGQQVLVEESETRVGCSPAFGQVHQPQSGAEPEKQHPREARHAVQLPERFDEKRLLSCSLLLEPTGADKPGAV